MTKATKKTVVVENTTARVVVLKAMKQKPLRLFPGYNNIDAETDFEAYFAGNDAAQGNLDDGTIRSVDPETLSKDQEKLAQAAKEKNDNLNRAYKTLKANKIALAAKDETLLKQEQTIATMQAEMEELKTMIKALTPVANK